MAAACLAVALLFAFLYLGKCICYTMSLIRFYWSSIVTYIMPRNVVGSSIGAIFVYEALFWKLHFFLLNKNKTMDESRYIILFSTSPIDLIFNNPLTNSLNRPSSQNSRKFPFLNVSHWCPRDLTVCGCHLPYEGS